VRRICSFGCLGCVLTHFLLLSPICFLRSTWLCRYVYVLCNHSVRFLWVQWGSPETHLKTGDTHNGYAMLLYHALKQSCFNHKTVRQRWTSVPLTTSQPTVLLHINKRSAFATKQIIRYRFLRAFALFVGDHKVCLVVAQDEVIVRRHTTNQMDMMKIRLAPHLISRSSSVSGICHRTSVWSEMSEGFRAWEYRLNGIHNRRCACEKCKNGDGDYSKGSNDHVHLPFGRKARWHRKMPW